MRRLSERILSAERVERVRERVREAINQDEAANMAVTFAVKEKNKRILALEKERKLLLEKHRTLQATASAPIACQWVQHLMHMQHSIVELSIQIHRVPNDEYLLFASRSLMWWVLDMPTWVCSASWRWDSH